MTAYDNAYAETRGRIAQLVTRPDDSKLLAPVPTCPAWKVKDVIAHLAGEASDFSSGQLEGAGSDEWTGRQVAARREHTIDQLLEEWDQHSVALEAMLRDGPERMKAIIVTDAACHEHDIRAALGAPGGRDTEASRIALETGISALGRRITEAGLPSLRVVTDQRDWVAGDGGPATSVHSDPFELTRALFGRRSPSQIKSLMWDAAPEPYVKIFSVFAQPTENIVE